jgi:hypothetical protein
MVYSRAAGELMRVNPMLRLTLVALSILFLTTCRGDPVAPQAIDVRGDYTLESVNGAPLPWRLLSFGPASTSVTAGTMTLNDGAQCRVSLTLTTTENGVVSSSTDAVDCQYTFSRGAISVNYPNGSVDTGLASASEVSLRSDGTIFVFRR